MLVKSSVVLQEPYKIKYWVNYSIATTFVGTLWLIENTKTLTVASVCKANVCCAVLINTCVKCTKLSKALKQVLMVKILAKWTCCENLWSPQTDVSDIFTKYINRVISNKQKKSQNTQCISWQHVITYWRLVNAWVSTSSDWFQFQKIYGNKQSDVLWNNKSNLVS